MESKRQEKFYILLITNDVAALLLFRACEYLSIQLMDHLVEENKDLKIIRQSCKG